MSWLSLAYEQRAFSSVKPLMHLLGLGLFSIFIQIEGKKLFARSAVIDIFWRGRGGCGNGKMETLLQRDSFLLKHAWLKPVCLQANLFSGSILATLYLFSLDGINFQMIITYESKDELKWNHYVVDNVSAVTGKFFTNWPV